MTGPFTEADAKVVMASAVRTWRISEDDTRFVLEILNAAYRSAASRPDGWVACPKEPTTEMVFEGAEEAWAGATGTYRAMLAASPYAIKESDGVERPRPCLPHETAVEVLSSVVDVMDERDDVAAKLRAAEETIAAVRELVEPHWDVVSEMDPMDTTNAQAAKAGLMFQILAILDKKED